MLYTEQPKCFFSSQCSSSHNVQNQQKGKKTKSKFTFSCLVLYDLAHVTKSIGTMQNFGIKMSHNITITVLGMTFSNSPQCLFK